jgi:hypothetical protein
MIIVIDDHRATCGVVSTCRVLPIAVSTYSGDAAPHVNPNLLPPRFRRGVVLKEWI